MRSITSRNSSSPRLAHPQGRCVLREGLRQPSRGSSPHTPCPHHCAPARGRKNHGTSLKLAGRPAPADRIGALREDHHPGRAVPPACVPRWPPRSCPSRGRRILLVERRTGRLFEEGRGLAAHAPDREDPQRDRTLESWRRSAADDDGDVLARPVPPVGDHLRPPSVGCAGRVPPAKAVYGWGRRA